VIAVAEETGAAPLAVLPSAVPMLREPAAPLEHVISSSSPLGGEGFPPRSCSLRSNSGAIAQIRASRSAERVRGK